MTTTRRLAAILAADVAGYSRLMGADEVGTLAALKAARREVVDPAIAEHKGRIVKTTGDGMLVEFSSAVDAVTCAMAVQEKMAARGGEIAFRIGVNVGDIIIDGDDIFGDGVNVAARVEGECEPGSVFLAANAFEQIRNKTPFAFDDLGDRQLKNIDRPVRVYAVRGATRSPAVHAASEPGKPLPLPDKPSIAVLPFQNMSGDPEQEYFADGMVEDIITALSRFKSLFVIARNSSFTYKGKAVDIKQVGRELGVRYVLEGSVRKAGGRVRITGQLIDAVTGEHLWADRFDGALEDVFELQDRVTELVVGAIAPTVDRVEVARTRIKRPDSFDAYDHVLKAREILTKQQGDRTLLAQAFSHAQEAVRLAPEHAGGHVLAAVCITQRYMEGQLVDIEREGSEAIAFARKAMALAPDDSQVLSMAGFALGNFEGNAIAIHERAVALNPNSAMGWSQLSWALVFNGQHDRALEAVDRALRLNPNDPGAAPVTACRAWALFLLDRHSEAASWAERAYLLNSTHALSLRAVAITAAAIGNRQRAHMAYKQFAPNGFSKQLERLKRGIKREQDFKKLAAAIQLASEPE